MSKTVQNFIYLALTAITVVGGYIFLRLSYKISDSFPFTQEIILIVLGTVATILITALLLNKQTEVELHKEQQVRFLELKSDVYQDLLQHLENVMIDGKTDHRDAVRLQFLSHRLALVASPEILAEFENFLKAYQTAVADQAVSSSDSNAINRALAELTIRIRKDLIGEQDKASHIHTD
ncbi:MAG TPA: hypothetical protein ENJ42_02010, partial [Hellea balneolensis]|nr:hypothetical protein [Hellea balneolensis]